MKEIMKELARLAVLTIIVMVAFFGFMAFVALMLNGLDYLPQYIGGFGRKRAYVQNPLQYANMKDVIEAIIDASGIPVLAHLNYYGMNDKNNRYLLSEFKKYAKDKAAMEVYYGAYTHEQRLQLKCLADEYGYMYSCGSDYHGHRKDDSLGHDFKRSDVSALLEALGE